MENKESQDEMEDMENSDDVKEESVTSEQMTTEE